MCRMHGVGGGHGPGVGHPAHKHGGRTQEWVAMRKAIAELIKEAQELDEGVK